MVDRDGIVRIVKDPIHGLILGFGHINIASGLKDGSPKDILFASCPSLVTILFWKLRGFIEQNLRISPPGITQSLSEYRHLIFDGTFLHRPKNIVALMDAETKTIIAGKYGVSESSMPQSNRFFQPLKQKGLNPIRCTIDGNPYVLKYLNNYGQTSSFNVVLYTYNVNV